MNHEAGLLWPTEAYVRTFDHCFFDYVRGDCETWGVKMGREYANSDFLPPLEDSLCDDQGHCLSCTTPRFRLR